MKWSVDSLLVLWLFLVFLVTYDDECVQPDDQYSIDCTNDIGIDIDIESNLTLVVVDVCIVGVIAGLNGPISNPDDEPFVDPEDGELKLPLPNALDEPLDDPEGNSEKLKLDDPLDDDD